MAKRPWTDITVRPKGRPEVALEPDGTVELYVRPVTLLLTQRQAVILTAELGKLLSDVEETANAGPTG